MLKIRLALVTACVCYCLNIFSQGVTTPKITVCEGYITGLKAIELVEQKIDARFSFNPSHFNLNRELYLCKRNASLLDVATLVFGRDVDLIAEKNHIIVKPKKKIVERPVELNGMVESLEDGTAIEGAYVFVDQVLVKTNPLGYFSYKSSTQSDSIEVQVKKDGFHDFNTQVGAFDKSVRLALVPSGSMEQPLTPRVSTVKTPSVENFWVTRMVVREQQVYTSDVSQNLKEKRFQLSLLPSVGLYYAKSGLYRFNSSINLLAGYVGEVRGVELGLGANIVRNSVKGFQFAGITNIVGGRVDGVQISSVSNVSIGNHVGGQVSAVSNTAWSKFKGFQFSAGVNIVKDNIVGLQLAPLNIAADSLEGMQLGALNVVSKGNGVQLAAGANVAGTNSGLQYSVGVNAAKRSTGAQLAVVNVCRQQDGLQLGLLNVADTVTGISIGLLSIVRRGYSHLDYSFSTNNFGGVRFKTGTHKFYNILTTSFRPDREMEISFGYGFGSSINLWRALGLDLDFTSSYVFENSKLNGSVNLLQQADALISFRVLKRHYLFCGVQLNMLSTNFALDENGKYTSTIPARATLGYWSNASSSIYIWGEMKVGIRL